jgi:hypothetical protein
MDVPAHCILLLAEGLELDPGDLSFGRIDYDALSRHLKGETHYIPQKYMGDGNLSRLFLASLIEYSDTHIDPIISDILLRKIQIRRQAFQQYYEKNSILLLQNALDFFELIGHPSETYFQMGAYFSSFAKSHLLEPKNYQNLSISEVYDYLIRSFLPPLIRSWDIHLEKLTSVSCRIRIVSETKVGNKKLCLWRSGLFASIPEILGLPRAGTQESSCIHSGDPECEHEMNFEYSVAVYKKKLKLQSLPLEP